MSQLDQIDSGVLDMLLAKYGTWRVVEHTLINVSNDLRLEEHTADRSTDVIAELDRDKKALYKCLLALTEEI